jgi:hypothetical protein
MRRTVPRMIKVKSGSAVMFHYLPGQHHHVAEWHNDIHRPEIHGVVPHVFYSQDFVAPPAYVNARQHADLPMSGGEYLSLYWSEGSLEELSEDNRKASQDRRNAGSYHPFQDVVWAARMRAIDAYPRADLGYDVNAAPFAPNTGLVLLAQQLPDASGQSKYAGWLEQVHVPRVLALGPFSACFLFSYESAGKPGFIQFWFVDRADPLESFSALRSSSAAPPEAARSIFAGAYQPVHSGQYDIYV